MTDHLQNAIAAGRYVMIAGPTAAGKSALAMTLAARIDGVIINADSMQLYRDLRILTARPDEQDEAQIPHRLYGVLDAAERASVARWLDLVAVEATAAREVALNGVIKVGFSISAIIKSSSTKNLVTSTS